MNDRSFKRTAKKAAKPGAKARGARSKPTAEAAPDHREKILRAAEALFSRKGFHGTGAREIADMAGVSLGNIYNHFATKEGLFAALMAELEARYIDAEQPIPQALAALAFPDGLEVLGEAAREQVRRFPSYLRLIYVDVIEFEGEHLGRLYGGMRKRFEAIFGEHFAGMKARGEIGDVDPLVAVMMCTITYMHYFTVEQLFGVRKHYGMDNERLIHEFARVFRNGILKR